jgi:hypothetical protein
MDIQTRINNYSAILSKKYEAEKIGLNDKDKNVFIGIPIKTIDKVKVWVKLLFSDTASILEICLSDFYEDEDMEDVYLHRVVIHNAKAFTKVAEYILVNINELKLDITGKLVNKKDIIDDQILEHQLLSGFDNIELYGDECCVCNDLTQTTTRCNHRLCYRCMTHIKPVENNDSYCEKDIPCPICRQDIRYFN